MDVVVDDLVSILDERGEVWRLGRIAGDSRGPMWLVELGFEGGRAIRTFRDSTIEAVLRAAVDDGPPLPVVPLRPLLLLEGEFTTERGQLPFQESSSGSYRP